MEKNESYLLFASCGRDGEGKGVRGFTWEESTGKLGALPAGGPETVDAASFVAGHPSRRCLYVLTNQNRGESEPSGEVLAYAFEPTGSLAALGSQDTLGSTPCYASVTASGSHLMVANFRQVLSDRASRGSVTVFELDPRGGILGVVKCLEHEGSSVHPERQTNSHPHAVVAHPNAPFFVIPDLGIDKMHIYRLDQDEPQLTEQTPFPAGAGPRHATFDPAGKTLFVITEMSNRIHAFDFDADTGRTSPKWDCQILPAQGGGGPADIVFHQPTGTVFGSLRHNPAIVSVRDGEAFSWQHEGIGNPRGIALSPGGGYLLAGNMAEDFISVHKISDAGELSEPLTQVEAKRPGCLLFQKIFQE